MRGQNKRVDVPRSNNTIMNNIIKAILTILALAFMWFALSKLTNYDARMKEYNYHMCVEVYGLDENCNQKGEPGFESPIPLRDIVK